MPTNKHAFIRYQALDKCFSNYGRKYFIEDLIDACNEAICKYTGIDLSVKRRQIYEDINFMESEEGFSIPLKRINEGKRTYYRYEDKQFSISKKPLSYAEMEQLKHTIVMLNRFKGLPQFLWMEDVLMHLESSFNLKEHVENAVRFDENPDLTGLHFFTPIFNAIINKQILQITYHGFSRPVIKMKIHPYQLRQYNNRWFLIGYNPYFEGKYPLTTLALDRMDNVQSLSGKEYRNNTIDLDDYYYDTIGLTIPVENELTIIRLRINYPLANYVLTKPFHASQKIIENSDDYIIIELNLIPNVEFENLVFEYAHYTRILEPEILRMHILERAQDIIRLNS